MATYKQITSLVRAKYGFTPASCWIAHAKALRGIARPENVDIGTSARPCPLEKRVALLEALRELRDL